MFIFLDWTHDKRQLLVLHILIERSMLSQSCVNFFAVQDRAPGEPFVAKSEKEAEMERLMKSMEVTNKGAK